MGNWSLVVTSFTMPKHGIHDFIILRLMFQFSHVVVDFLQLCHSPYYSHLHGYMLIHDYSPFAKITMCVVDLV